jgi:hypothetical protein
MTPKAREKPAMKVPDKYEPIDENEFERFDKAMTELLRVPYSAVQKELAKEKKKKARKKRAKESTSGRASSRDSGEA